jgi:hypothetical protein
LTVDGIDPETRSMKGRRGDGDQQISDRDRWKF